MSKSPPLSSLLNQFSNPANSIAQPFLGAGSSAACTYNGTAGRLCPFPSAGLNLSKRVQDPETIPASLTSEVQNPGITEYRWGGVGCLARSLAQQGPRCSAGRKKELEEERGKGEGSKVVVCLLTQAHRNSFPGGRSECFAKRPRLDLYRAVGEGGASPGRSSF